MADDAHKPEWWRKARALEMAGRFAEAEETIRNGVPHLSFAYVTADLYRERMLRLMEARDDAGALDAFKRSRNFIHFYASLATSGGEGAALSAERDAFLTQLVASYGSNPSD